MVNYKSVAVLMALGAMALAAPAPDCTEKHYDQRQNGTENYRLNIDGVVIAVAPADTLIEVASDFTDLLDISDLEEYLKPPSSKPTPKPEVSDPKPDSDAKPDADVKPDTEAKPVPEKPAEAPLSDVSVNSETKPQRKDASPAKQEKVQRFKNRLAHLLVPLLRKTRHH